MGIRGVYQSRRGLSRVNVRLLPYSRLKRPKGSGEREQGPMVFKGVAVFEEGRRWSRGRGAQPR